MSDLKLLANELSRLGTRHVFGIPGEGSSLELLSELERLGCRFHSTGHEAVAALMAGGYGRVSGTPGVSLSIKGPGFSNMLAGIASNWLDRNPALSLSESYGPGSSPHRMHKRVSHGAMVSPVVKAYADNVVPDLLPRLWDFCISEEPGPVHLDISPLMSARTFECAVVGDELEPLPVEIRQRLKAAQRPVVIAGALAARRAWRSKLAALRIPIFTTVAGKGAVDEALQCSAGVFTNNGGPSVPERLILPRADLIVGLGLRTTEILDVKSLPAPLIVLDELANRPKGLAAVAEAVGGEESFLEVLDLLADKEWGSEELNAAKVALKERLMHHPWLPAPVFRMFQEALPESTRFVLDTGNFCVIGEHVLMASRPNHVMGSPIARSMGVALPLGIGAALAGRGEPIVVFVGDGGVRMYPESITLAVREKLPVLVILMSDGYYGSIRQVALRKGLTQKPLRLESGSWLRGFSAFGCPVERIESLHALQNALGAWKATHGPLFLELTFDADAYMNMTDGIR